MGVCRRQTDFRGLQGASHRVQCLGTGPGLRFPHAQGSGRRPKQCQARPRSEEACRPGRSRSRASPEPSNRKPNWPRSESSGPEQTRADLATGLGCTSPAAARVLPPSPLDANENQEKPTTSVPSFSGPLPSHLPRTPRRPRRSS